MERYSSSSGFRYDPHYDTGRDVDAQQWFWMDKAAKLRETHDTVNC